MRMRSLKNASVLTHARLHEASKQHASFQWRPFGASTALRQKGDPKKDIAVIGGGVTGLATTYYLSSKYPDVPVHLYESGPKLGGWIQTKHVDVGDGSVVFEQGPRNLRPSTVNGMITLDLIDELGIQDQMMTTPKTSNAAKNRFVYYPDHLVRVPTTAFGAVLGSFWEPALSGLVSGILKEPFLGRRPSTLEDESVGDFVSRRIGSQMADNIVSAVIHGVYAGDLYQLSAKSLLPLQWHLEGKHGSILQGILKERTPMMTTADAHIHREMLDKGIFEKFDINNTSVYTFRRGIQTLVEALEKTLEKRPNVHVKLQTKIQSIGFNSGSSEINIKTATADNHHTNAICTLPASTLSSLSVPALPAFAQMSAVTVMVVNLYYKNANLLPVQGFGYLIPRSVSVAQNPERALGVVFDSIGTVAQDTVDGTKITVMLGGHWWGGWEQYPDEGEGAAMAKCVLARHLGIEEEPTAINVALQKDCIPQYTVGHDRRMDDMEAELQSGFKGRLKVAGSSYTGVGLNDCVRAARDTVRELDGPSAILRPNKEWS
ncbi:MAG: oxygen-dependent protoporphyrinogen oxidase [Sclerophora amabilis]|nr:MAG: oxygen-dependent protoporphyrinogen oxidase [Sclerophora amabilis]